MAGKMAQAATDGVRIWFGESSIKRLSQNVVVGSCLQDMVVRPWW
jgi:hypothetical protein